MLKPITAKPGKLLLLFLLIGIVALQSSFTYSITGNNLVKSAFTDTSSSRSKTGSYFSITRKIAVYDSLHLKDAGLSKKIFAMALKGMSKLVNKNHIKDSLLAIIDFSQPSTNRRL